MRERIDQLTLRFVARTTPTTCIGVARRHERTPSGHLCAQCLVEFSGKHGWYTTFDKYWWGRHEDCKFTHTLRLGGEPGCAACSRLFQFLTPTEWEAVCRTPSTT